MVLDKSECVEEECPRRYYRYYDTHDGCDIDKKMFALARWGAVIGMVVAGYDILMFSHARGSAMFTRVARHVVPLTLMGFTFPLVSSGLVQLRHSDDRLNYFLGGVACGPLMGLYTKSAHGAVVGGTLLGCLALAQKEALIYDTSLFPCYRTHRGDFHPLSHDYTLREDPKVALMKKCTLHAGAAAVE